jgi:hypothetical protein
MLSKNYSLSLELAEDAALGEFSIELPPLFFSLMPRRLSTDFFLFRDQPLRDWFPALDLYDSFHILK